MKKNTFLTLGLLLSVTAFAQINEDSLSKPSADISEIVIYETRLQLSSSLKNRNLQIVDKEQIKKLPVRSVNELLTYVSGVDLRQRGPFGTQADLSIDGGSFEQNLVLLNGQKISDPQTGHNSLNIPVPLEAIERIEIVRGPSARLYGVNSLTGVVNIVTTNPKKDGVFAHAYAGTSFKKDEEETGHNEVFNGRGVQLGGSLVREKHNHMLFGSHESGNGYRYNTAFHNNKIFYQGNINPNDQNSLMVLGGLARNSFGANGFYASPGDKESKEIVNTYLVSLSSKHLLTDRLTLAPSVAYRYNYDDYRYFRHKLDVARSQHYSHTLTSNVKGEYEADFGTIALGAEMRYEEINSSNIGDRSRSNYGMYAEFRRTLFERLDMNVGAYLNYNSFYGWQVFPGVDASYAFNPNWKAVLSAGTSQRIPSFTDLYLDQRPGNIGNPNLDPEQAYQVDLGGKYVSDRFSADAFVFYRDISDFIDWVRDTNQTPWQPENASSNKTTGFNSSVRYTLGSSASLWTLGLSYTYLSPEVTGGQAKAFSKYAIESFKHQFVGSLHYAYENFSAMVANRYNQRLSYKSYWLTDVRLGYTHKEMTYYFDAQNIFDANYIEAGAVPMPGRWFTLGIKFNTL